MRTLAARFDEAARREASGYGQLITPARERGSVLRDPASEQRIAETERRLGVRLPPSYRAFLLVSDGAYASGLGADLEGQERHGLVPVDEVERATEDSEDPMHLGLAEPELNDPANDFPLVAGDPQPVQCYLRYCDGVRISRRQTYFQLVLVPRPPQPEWELWDFFQNGPTGHASFADFLEWYIGRADRAGLGGRLG
jgi:SMI1 / KNR4 family (SUKH-1)